MPSKEAKIRKRKLLSPAKMFIGATNRPWSKWLAIGNYCNTWHSRRPLIRPIWKRKEPWFCFRFCRHYEFFPPLNNTASLSRRHAFSRGCKRIDLKSPCRFSMLRVKKSKRWRRWKRRRRRRSRRMPRRRSLRKRRNKVVRGQKARSLAPWPLNTGANGKNRLEWEASSPLVVERSRALR